MIDVINLQRRVQIDLAEFKRFSKTLLRTIPEAIGKEASVAFVSDRRMIELNKLFRGKDSTTDVLSFPYEVEQFNASETPKGVTLTGVTLTFIGDIVISAERAAKQAVENGLTLENEIKQLVLHGLLHLCGYDHENDNGEMNARELELRDKLGI
jgi:probable rRNA maturation factor